MAETLANGLDPRKKLYSALVSSSDKEIANQVKKFSYNKFNSLLDDNDFVNDLFLDISERGIVLDPKNPRASKDPVEFANAFVYKELLAPKPQAAPKQQAVAPPVMEEEDAYIPEPPPAIGSREYDAQLQAQYGGMAPTLGATFGGVPAAFETKEQKKQEQISPVFKAQQLAFEDVPIASEQRRAQREFAKATKEQQKAAVRGGTGFEYQQKESNKERGIGGKTSDLLSTIASGGERIGKGIAATLENYVQGTLRAGLPEIEATESIEKIARNEMYKNATEAQNAFQEEVAKRNIQTSVLDAIEKGEYNRVPEAVLYTIGDAAMQIIPAILTMGGSTYFQTLPEAYKNGVDAIANEKGITPEQVVASGEDAMLVAEISTGIQSGLEFAGAGLVSNSIASRGGYKVIRDFLIKNGGNRTLARAAGLSGVALGEGLTEYLQEGTGQIGESAAKSPSVAKFLDKLPEELFTSEAKKRRRESFVGGVIGGGALGGGGQLVQSAMDRTLFEAPKIGKATQRPDYEIAQTDDKIQQRSNMLKAMESAIQANPEAEGQIRERYRKLTDALELTDEEVLRAYDGISQLPPSPEKDRILQGLEQYMAEKGIQPEPASRESGLGELMRQVAPEETIPAAPVVEQPIVEETPIEEAPAEEVVTDEAITEEPSLEESLLGIVPQEPVTEEAPVEEQPLTKEQSRVKDIFNDIYFNVPGGKNGQILDDGFSNSFKALDKANKVGGNQYSAHGMGKSSVGSAFTDLYTLLTRGIDPSRGGGRLYTAPLSGGQKGAGAGIGTASGNAYMDGPFTIVANKGVGSITDVSEIGGIIVNDGIVNAKPEILDALREAFPNIIFESTSNTDKLVEQLNQKAEQQVAPAEEVVAEEVPAAPTPKGKGVAVEFPTELSVSEVKPYAEVPDNYYRPDQQLKFNQGNYYEPVRVIAHPDVIRAITIGSRLGDAQKRKTVSDSDIEFANKIAKQLGYTNDAGNGNAIMLHRAVKDLAKENRSKNEEVFMVIGNEAKAPKPAPVTPTAPKAQPVAEKPQPKKEEKPAPKAEPKEEKPTTGVPQEGSEVELPPQSKYSTGPRKMVFKDGQWKQEVGGELTSVGGAVQQQAQEAFSGKTEGTKTEETKPAPKAPETKPAKKAAEAEFNKGDKVMWEGEERTILSNVKMGNEWKYQIDLGKGKSIWTNGLGIELEKAKAEKAAKTEAASQTEFTSKQEGNASTEFDGMKKPSKIKTKSFDNKHGKGAFERMQNITQNFEDIMDGLSEKIKQDCL
jgi:hypothetical protein